MTFFFGSRISTARVFWTVTVLMLSALNLAAQEQPQYTTEEYAEYQAITGESSPAKKAALVVAFVKARPQSTLKPHVLADYQNMMKQLETSGRWNEAIAAGEQVAAAMPGDMVTVSLLAAAYQKTKNNAKFVAFGEKVFAANPNGNIAYYLAKTYLEMGNDAKFVEWGEKVVGFMPDNYEILLDMTKKYGEARRYAQAIKYGQMCLKAFQGATRPESTPEATWKNYSTHLYATCHYIVGNAQYETKSYAAAVQNLESSLKYFSRNEMAYYHLAHSYWQQNKIDLAMKNFAKAYLLNGSSARAARQYLENLYKSTHQQTLTGLERVIDKARAELKTS
jgi:tetratricopeptide (TPR) repeat protein